MTKKYILVYSFLLLLFSCKNYNELEPSPVIKSLENKLTSLKDKDDSFKLKLGEKYFLKFPSPLNSDFYLILDVKDKTTFTSILTNSFDDEKQTFDAIPDESADNTTLVFSTSKDATFYYWVISAVPTDQILNAEYRFVPKWRYKFEQKRDALQGLLNEEKISRDTYESIGKTFKTNSFDYTGTISSLTQKIKKLEKGQSDLDDISNVIPQNIDPNDPAFKSYTHWNSVYKEEITFQKKYLALLNSYKTFGNMNEFLMNSGRHVDLLTADLSLYSPEIISNIKKSVRENIKEIVRSLDSKLKTMSSSKNLDWNTESLLKLANLTGESEKEVERLHKLKITNNYILTELKSIRKEITSLNVSTFPQWPSNSFYAGKIKSLNVPKRKLSRVDYSALNSYKSYGFVKELRAVLKDLNRNVTGLKRKFNSSNSAVQSINSWKTNNNYKEIINGLKTSINSSLKNHYLDIDKKSLDFQKSVILSDLSTKSWKNAESNIATLHQDKVYLSLNSISSSKINTLIDLENQLLDAILEESNATYEQFINANELTSSNIEALYSSPIFLPVHSPSFKSLKRRELENKLISLSRRLAKAKSDDFPKRSISALYTAFTANKDEEAVYQARAIQEHRKFYKGNDVSIFRKMHLSNTREAKKITESAKYSNIYVLPVTNKDDKTYRYIFRIDIQIERKNAKFPVWDVTLKLPKEIGEQSEFRKWFRTIKMDGKEIKNEGRYTITSPDPKDNYKMQVTPVQAKKGKTNVFEIVFTHPEFKVFEISAMLQRPIVKK